jgi:tellurium resistance protein TerD
MAINLTKGQTIDLRKNDKGDTFDLSTVTIGLGWDLRKKGGFLSGLFGGGDNSDFDLDAMAFLMDSNGKVANLGRSVQTKSGKSIALYESDVIFFNSKNHPSKQIWLTGDNRTGQGSGDDEQIIVKLDALDSKYQKILFFVTIYQGLQKGQDFSKVSNAYIRAVDARGKEITRFSLSGDDTLQGMSSLAFAEAYRKDGEWKFRALAEPQRTDVLAELLRKYTY